MHQGDREMPEGEAHLTLEVGKQLVDLGGRCAAVRALQRDRVQARDDVDGACRAADPAGCRRVALRLDARRLGRAYLAALRRAREVGPLRRADELAAAAQAIFGRSADVCRTGSMAWLRASAEGS